jgi:Ca2+-binding EF-hand superfamily protein
MRHPKIFNQCGLRYLALLIKDNAVPIDECFCQFASIEAVTEGIETIKISKDSFLEVAAYLLGEFLDAFGRPRLFEVMDIDHDGFLNIHDWRESLASAEYWMSEEGKYFSAATRIQSVWRGHYERSALMVPASGLFTIEAVFEPTENQKYWDDEDEEVFFNHIPTTVIDGSLSARDILSALTALAQSKGFTPHSLFVHICKSSAYEPDKSFIMDEFVESFMNLSGEKMTDELHEALSKAFQQLLDLNGDSRVSSTEFFWVMRQYFEAQHAATWIDDETAPTIKTLFEQPSVAQEPGSKASISNPVSLSNGESSYSFGLNEDSRVVHQLASLEALGLVHVGDSIISPTSPIPVSTENMINATSISDKAHLSLASSAALQLADAAAKAAELKKSSEAEASNQLAEAAAIKLAAEKLFAEATELKRKTEAAAATQIAEAAALKKAAEVAAAATEASAATQIVEAAAFKKAAEAAAAERSVTGTVAVQSAETSASQKSAVQFASDQPSIENPVPMKSSKVGVGHDMTSTEGLSSITTYSSVSSSTSVGPSPKGPSTSKPVAFDPRSLAHGYDPAAADLKSLGPDTFSGAHEMHRPASSGDPHTPKTVRFAPNRPSTSDGSRSLGSDFNFSYQSHVPQSHQSRQPNSQQQSIMKTQEDAIPAFRRAQERPSTSYTSSADHGQSVISNKPTLAIKGAGLEVTKRVLFVDAENACTWIRACAQKIGARYIDKNSSSVALLAVYTFIGFYLKVLVTK